MGISKKLICIRKQFLQNDLRKLFFDSFEFRIEINSRRFIVLLR